MESTNRAIIRFQVRLINDIRMGTLNCGELNRGRISSVGIFDLRNVNSGIFHGCGGGGDFGQFRWPNS